jgi:hypothetical protein
MTQRAAGRLALITVAARGIGAARADRLADPAEDKAEHATATLVGRVGAPRDVGNGAALPAGRDARAVGDRVIHVAGGPRG